MAVDIFISYRRSDTGGYALALFNELHRRFDDGAIFYDGQSIEAGSDFPERIETGLKECKVLLAVIARDWLDVVDDAGARRLDNPADFVRREISMALSQQKVVIPVLFAGVGVPAPERLPDELRALSEKQVLRVGTDGMHNFFADVDELLRVIAKIPGLAPARTRNAPAVTFNRRRLTCLCDRSEQDEGVRDTIRAQMRLVRETRRPFVMIVHGRANEAHDAFVERLEAFSVPRLLQDARRQSPVKFLPAFNALPLDGDQSRFDRRLRDAMAEHLKLTAVDSDDDIIAEIRDSSLGAAVAVVGWRASEIRGDPRVALNALLDYWSRFPDIPATSLVGCIVCFKYDAPKGGWLSRMLPGRADAAEGLRSAVLATSSLQDGDRPVVWRVLPELPSVTLPDLSRWVSEVATLIGGGFYVPEKTLQTISGGGTKPMDDVLPDLEKLLPQD